MMCFFLVALLVFSEKLLLETSFLVLFIIVHSRCTDDKKRAIYRDHVFNNLSGFIKKKEGGNNLKAEMHIFGWTKQITGRKALNRSFQYQPVRNTRFRA